MGTPCSLWLKGLNTPSFVRQRPKSMVYVVGDWEGPKKKIKAKAMYTSEMSTPSVEARTARHANATADSRRTMVNSPVCLVYGVRRGSFPRKQRMSNSKALRNSINQAKLWRR